MRIRPPKFVERMFPTFIWTFPDETDTVFLTFDDGPTPDVTPWIVDKLKEYDAKATFFCLGKNVEQHPQEFKLIKESGHAVGNHTYSHQKGWGMSTGNYIQDIDLADNYIKSHLFRPPYGQIKPAQARVLSERYKIIMWDVLSLDYSANISRRKCANMVISGSRPGSIIVFHDSLKSARNMKYALPKALDYFASKNWKTKIIE